MKKEQPKIEHPLYLAQINSSSDRNAIVDTYLRRLIAVAKKQGLPIDDDSLLIKQKMELERRNARIVAQQNKEKQVTLARRREQNSNIFFKHFEFEFRDENGVWMSCKADKSIAFKHKNKYDQVDYVIKTSPRQLVETSLINAIGDLKGNAKQVKSELHRIYNGYELSQRFPLDAGKPQHIFELKLKWRV